MGLKEKIDGFKPQMIEVLMELVRFEIVQRLLTVYRKVTGDQTAT